MSQIKVLEPGFQTTVQDLGRYGYAHLGISAAGAADALSLRLGNLLVENPVGAAGIEMTLVGGTFEFKSQAVIALTGSDFEPMLDSHPVPMWLSILVQSGQVLQCGPTKGGARCYLCIRGGVHVQAVLSSASTHVLTGIGGLEGRALRKGDFLHTRATGRSYVPLKVNPDVLSRLVPANVLRTTAGAQSEIFSEGAHAVLHNSPYSVREESNRMGLRLRGERLERAQKEELITEGVSIGAIQVPQDGQPIILFVEQPTTGGYPKIANVISADFHCLGQLKPRDEVHFELVLMEQARALLHKQESLLNPSSLIPA